MEQMGEEPAVKLKTENGLLLGPRYVLLAIVAIEL